MEGKTAGKGREATGPDRNTEDGRSPAVPSWPEKDLPHLGLNTLAFLLPPVGAGLYLALRHTMPRRGGSAARWAWAGAGFYAGCYLVLWLCFR